MKLLKLFSAILALIFMVACSSSNKSKSVDIYEVQATADAALSLARLDSLRIASISLSLDTVSRKVNFQDSVFSVMPIARIEENNFNNFIIMDNLENFVDFNYFLAQTFVISPNTDLW
jgi:hypothetical protein